jgi:hypothetical protein
VTPPTLRSMSACGSAGRPVSVRSATLHHHRPVVG